MRLWDLVWLGWLVAFLVLELLAVAHVAPWQTLSSTAWGVEKLTVWAKILALVGLTILMTHIVFRFPD